MTLDPTEWEARRARAERAVRIAARDLLAAHGSQFVQVEMVPGDASSVVSAGSAAMARQFSAGSGALSDKAVQQIARVMTRLGVTTNYRPDVFRADFETQILAMCEAVHTAIDTNWRIT